MIDCIASRAFSHEGHTFHAGKRYSISEGQFSAWSEVGLVEPAPQKPASPVSAPLSILPGKASAKP